MLGIRHAASLPTGQRGVTQDGEPAESPDHSRPAAPSGAVVDAEDRLKELPCPLMPNVALLGERHVPAIVMRAAGWQMDHGRWLPLALTVSTPPRWPNATDDPEGREFWQGVTRECEE